MNKPIVYGIAVAVIISIAGILISTETSEHVSYDLVEDELEIDEIASITKNSEKTKVTIDSEGKKHYVINTIEKPNLVG